MKLDRETESILLIAGVVLIGLGAHGLGYEHGARDACAVLNDEVRRRAALATENQPQQLTDGDTLPNYATSQGVSGLRRS